MPASVWKGPITFGLISIPVRLVRPARSVGVPLRELHRTATPLLLSHTMYFASEVRSDQEVKADTSLVPAKPPSLPRFHTRSLSLTSMEALRKSLAAVKKPTAKAEAAKDGISSEVRSGLRV